MRPRPFSRIGAAREFLEDDFMSADFYLCFKMPFWRSKDKDSNGSNGEKVNYKARLEHKQYLVRRKCYLFIPSVAEAYFPVLYSS